MLLWIKKLTEFTVKYIQPAWKLLSETVTENQLCWIKRIAIDSIILEELKSELKNYCVELSQKLKNQISEMKNYSTDS